MWKDFGQKRHQCRLWFRLWTLQLNVGPVHSHVMRVSGRSEGTARINHHLSIFDWLHRDGTDRLDAAGRRVSAPISSHLASLYVGARCSSAVPKI